ncbi:MAG: gliding motility lipoprotein GldJ, partial [Bacteroidia bacterium]|nr:gliding motility lipoprotein GldJ [Bacteroidia bacterium]
DGDINSSVYYGSGEDALTSPGQNKLMYEYGVYSMINDKARVFKGGNWHDRAYWMGPGTRRFLDQRQTAPWLGFRCCMTRVGSPVGM